MPPLAGKCQLKEELVHPIYVVVFVDVTNMKQVCMYRMGSDRGISNIGGQNRDMVQCSQCYKKFASKKALFGHMRTHPIRPPRQTAPDSGQGRLGGFFLMLAAGDAAIKKERKRSGTARAHECTVCHRVFRTGQALGGHKRCHWGGSSSAGAGQGEPFLDLNEPAPLCEEDMEAAHGMLEVVPACQESVRDILMISGWY